ncbi:hypothetical protein ACVWWG_005573 [Bradyrhizobium sp. LB7.2]
MMGIHIAMTLPGTEVEIMAPTTPVEDHPVAEHAAHEQGRHAGGTMRGVAERSAFADISDGRADLVGLLRETERRDESHHEGDGEGAAEVADEDEAPVAQHAAKRDAGTLVDQGER